MLPVNCDISPLQIVSFSNFKACTFAKALNFESLNIKKEGIC